MKKRVTFSDFIWLNLGTASVTLLIIVFIKILGG